MRPAARCKACCVSTILDAEELQKHPNLLAGSSQGAHPLAPPVMRTALLPWPPPCTSAISARGVPVSATIGKRVALRASSTPSRLLVASNPGLFRSCPVTQANVAGEIWNVLIS